MSKQVCRKPNGLAGHDFLTFGPDSLTRSQGLQV
jgi:hypothetical protein